MATFLRLTGPYTPRKRDGFTHSCHKTDPKADGYRGGKKRECAGYLQMLMNEYDKTPGAGGVWKSVPHMLFAYLKHWRKNGVLDTDEFDHLLSAPESDYATRRWERIKCKIGLVIGGVIVWLIK